MPKKKYRQFIKGTIKQQKPVSPVSATHSSDIEVGKNPAPAKESTESLKIETTSTVKSADRANVHRASFVTNQMTTPESKKLYKSMDDEVKKEYSFHGIPVCIEWPAGQPRMYGKDNSQTGKTSFVDYGYFKGTSSSDGGGVDVYVGPNHESKNIYLLLQKPTSWDVKQGILEPEPKYMIGFGDITEAEEAYKASMPEEYFMSIGEVIFDDFLEVINVARKKKSEIISKSNNVSSDFRTGFKQTQDELKKYLEGEQSATANQQTTHTAELSSEEQDVIKATPNLRRLALAKKLQSFGREPRATSEGIMSREHERKYSRTPLVRKTRLVDSGQTSAIPLFPNRLDTINKNKRKMLKSLLSIPLFKHNAGNDIKIIFKL